MSVLMREDQAWLVSNWVSRAFFEDALPFLDQAPTLAENIRFCVDAGLDTLDLRDGHDEAFRELKILAGRIVHQNMLLQGSNFHDPVSFPVYMRKLEELCALVDRVLAHMGSTKE